MGKDALRDGLKAVTNVLEDEAVVAAHARLEEFKKSVSGKARLGVEIFAKSLLVIPKVLIENSGLDIQEHMLSLLAAHDHANADKKKGDRVTAVGIDLHSGETLSPE